MSGTGRADGGLPFAMAAAAVAYFISLPSLTTAFWTPAAFLIAAAVALAPMLYVRPVERIAPLLFGATGLLLLALPVLRAAAGGPGWGTALATGHDAVPVMDVFVILGGAACIASCVIALRSRREPATVATSIAQPAE